MELLSKGSPTVHFQSTLRGIKMQFNSTPKLKKCEPFATGNQELDDLLTIYHEQGIQMANAEVEGLPEPVLECPQLPAYVNWSY